MRKKNWGLALMAVSIVAAATLFGCAPKSPDSVPSEASDNAGAQVAFTWSAESDCSVCHATEQTSLTDAACLASTHEQQNLACIDCHSDTSGLSSVHEGLTSENTQGAKRLKKTKVTNCESCHALDELAAATEGSTVLTDDKGTTVNPHALPENQDHAEFGAGCTECHTMHKADADTAKNAAQFCTSCHHANVYECRTCHQ